MAITQGTKKSYDITAAVGTASGSDKMQTLDNYIHGEMKWLL